MLFFDVKHDGRHKHRLVVGRIIVNLPFSSAVTLREMYLVLFLVKLNGLNYSGTNDGNTYLGADAKEKVDTTRSSEFGGLGKHL